LGGLPLDASKLDAVVLTHAHSITADICRASSRRLSRTDFLHAKARGTCARSCCRIPRNIQEEDARTANRHGYSKHAPRCAYSSLDAAGR